MARLEEVFCLSGVPTYTFVAPPRFPAIKVALRTPGRCVVVEGPSGIGKTSTISRAIEELDINEEILTLSARRPNDREMIDSLPDMGDIGTVIIDDFHRLEDATKNKISDFMKVLADVEDPKSKLILIGINKAGDQLVQYAHDLGLRIDVFRMEANPDELIRELIEKGERELNIAVGDKNSIINRSNGSFHIAQVLCHHICLESEITESSDVGVDVSYSIEVIIDRVMADFGRQFSKPAQEFARGSKIRREGRAPYLHILKWLAESDEWSLDLSDALQANPEHRGSVGQVVEKGHLETLLREKSEILEPFFHYESTTKILGVEDPKLIFFLRNISWKNFSRKVGFTSEYFPGRYDFALSFAGNDRGVAERIFNILSDREISVFYDKNEQHRIVAVNVEDYLSPIYYSEASYVIPLLSPDYPTRIWTKFESDVFRTRFGEGAVIPLRFSTVQDGFYSEESKYGGLAFDPDGDVERQLSEICDVLAKRLEEDRSMKN